MTTERNEMEVAFARMLCEERRKRRREAACVFAFLLLALPTGFVVAGTVGYVLETDNAASTKVPRLTVETGDDVAVVKFQNCRVGIDNTTPTTSLHIGNGSGPAGIVLDDNVTIGTSPTISQAALGTVFGGAASDAATWHTHGSGATGWTLLGVYSPTTVAGTNGALVDTGVTLSNDKEAVIVFASDNQEVATSTLSDRISFFLDARRIVEGGVTGEMVGWSVRAAYLDQDGTTVWSNGSHVSSGDPEASTVVAAVHIPASGIGASMGSATAEFMSSLPSHSSGWAAVRYSGKIFVRDTSALADVAVAVYVR